MPIYEFKCTSCGHEKEMLIVKQSELKGSNKLGCDKCKGMYEKILSVTSPPIIEGFNAKNRYSHEHKKRKKKDDKTDKR